MNCPVCRQPMTILGRHWICAQHHPPAFLLVEFPVAGAADSASLAEAAAAFPLPLACACQRLRHDLSAHQTPRDALRHLVLLKDCLETLVKYLTVIALSARLDRGDPVGELDREILSLLVHPSLGTWASILNRLVQTPQTRADARLAPLVLFASRRFFDWVREFTELRNRVLGHGLVRDPREDRADVNVWLPRLDQMLADARFLAAWELVQALQPPRSWMGAEPGSQPIRTAAERVAEAAVRPGEFLLIPPAGRPISLHPFLYLLHCPGCQQADRVFLYDSLSKYTGRSKKAAMTENAGGHRETFTEPAQALAERIAEDLLLEAYASYARHFEVLEGKLVEFDFEGYRRRVGPFVGRRPVLEAIACFLGQRPVPLPDGPAAPVDRGYFVLIAEPGLGKTALLTQWIDHNDFCSTPIRFFWRRGRNLTRLDFLRHVYHGLLRKYRIEENDPPREEQDYPRKLDSLLKRISEDYLAENEREVLVIDGLDEAGDSHARLLAIQALARGGLPSDRQ